jgi:hypothetical protein
VLMVMIMMMMMVVMVMMVVVMVMVMMMTMMMGWCYMMIKIIWVALQKLPLYHARSCIPHQASRRAGLATDDHIPSLKLTMQSVT